METIGIIVVIQGLYRDYGYILGYIGIKWKIKWKLLLL